MLLELNLQRFVASTPDKNVNPNIKIKFKDTLTFTSDVNVYPTFTCDNVEYNHIYYDSVSKILFYMSSTESVDVCTIDDDGVTTWNADYFKIIEIDPTQTNFQTFITAMNDNIDGVELEAGTYKWVDSPTFLSSDYNWDLIFKSFNRDFVSIDLLSATSRIAYHTSRGSQTIFLDGSFTLEDYKTITTTENQYIDYDFYSYAILDGMLVKQSITPTYSFKHWKASNVKINKTGNYYFKPYTILGLYRIDNTLTNCIGATSNSTKIQENGEITLTFTANDGYELPDSVEVTNVTSYNWNKSTGVLAISKPTGDVSITIVAESALTQLATPTNVSVTDTTLTFDEVENATSYEVYVDNVSIGTHSIVTGNTLTFGEDLEVKVDGTSVTSPYTLTQNCTITASNTNYSDIGSTTPSVKVNDTEYNNDTTISISGTDIDIINNNTGIGQQFPWGQITVTINYTKGG